MEDVGFSLLVLLPFLGPTQSPYSLCSPSGLAGKVAADILGYLRRMWLGSRFPICGLKRQEECGWADNFRTPFFLNGKPMWGACHVETPHEGCQYQTNWDYSFALLLSSLSHAGTGQEKTSLCTFLFFYSVKSL